MAFFVNNLLLYLPFGVFYLNTSYALQLFSMELLAGFSPDSFAVSIVIYLLFYDETWRVFFPLFDITKVLIIFKLVIPWFQKHHVNDIRLVLQMISVLLCLPLPIIMLPIVHFAPLLARDKLASLRLLPLPILNMVAISVLLLVVVPPVILVPYIFLPVFLPNDPFLVFTFFKSNEVLCVSLIFWLLAQIFVNCFLLIQVVQLEESLPRFSFHDVVKRVVWPFYISVLELSGERAPFVLTASVLNFNFEDALVVFC